MTLTTSAMRYGQRRFAQKLGRSLPWVGAALALAGIASAIRRKGVVAGTLDTALNTMPVVGSLKAAAEYVRGRDFIRDRASA